MRIERHKSVRLDADLGKSVLNPDGRITTCAVSEQDNASFWNGLPLLRYLLSSLLLGRFNYRLSVADRKTEGSSVHEGQALAGPDAFHLDQVALRTGKAAQGQCEAPLGQNERIALQRTLAPAFRSPARPVPHTRLMQQGERKLSVIAIARHEAVRRQAPAFGTDQGALGPVRNQ